MAVEWKRIAFADDLHPALTIDGTSPLSLSGQAISLKNDAAAAITEVDTGALADSDTVIPTSKAVKTAIGSGGGISGTADYVPKFGTDGSSLVDSTISVDSGNIAHLPPIEIIEETSYATDGDDKLTADGTFATASGWSGTGWTISGGKATHTPGDTAPLVGTTNVKISSFVKLLFTISDRTAGNLSAVSLGVNEIPAVFSSSANYNTYLLAPAANVTVSFTPTSTFDGSISTVSLLEQIPSTGAARFVASNGTTSPLEIRAGASGRTNSFLGFDAGRHQVNDSTKINNLALGHYALRNLVGRENVGVGQYACGGKAVGSLNPIGNTAIGYSALEKNATGGYNVAVGMQVLAASKTGSYNVAIGHTALYNATTGAQNVAIGAFAGVTLTSGQQNVFIGQEAGARAFTTGSRSTFIGFNAGRQNTSSNTVAIGFSAGNFGTGSNCVFIGNMAGYYETGANKLFIDYSSRASEADAREKALIYGVFSTAVANQYLYINANLSTYGIHVGGTSAAGKGNLLVDGTGTIAGAFGCNSKTAQTPYASGGALSAYSAGTCGFDTDAHAQEIHTLVTNIRAALVANGIMS